MVSYICKVKIFNVVGGNNLISEQLIQRIKTKDRTAFKELFDMYREKVYSMSYIILKDKTASEDILQEVFIQVYLKIKDLKHVGAFEVWLYRITMNCCRKFINKENKLKTINVKESYDEYFDIQDDEINTPENIISNQELCKAYNCSTADVANGLVKLDIVFISKEEQPTLLNQTKSLEALLKSYNYNLIINSGFGFEIEIPENFNDGLELKGQYLQYCNELSKAIGYDMATLNVKTVELKGYSVNRAGDKSKAFDVISIGFKGKICGVWMREDKTGRLLSLTGESFAEVTKKSWQQWILEKGIKVNDKGLDNEFKDITLSELFNMGVKK